MKAYDNGLQELALFWLRDGWIQNIKNGSVSNVVELTEWFQTKNLYVGGPFCEQKGRLK